MPRPVQTILYSTHFARAVKRLPAHLRNVVKKREALFRKDCFDPTLKTHKLHGKQTGYWSFSLTRECRVVFTFVDDETVEFIDAGDHSIYQ